MIQTCRFVYPYYENPTMLARQVDNWNRYAGELRKHIRIVVVDDCSQNHHALPILQKCKAPVMLYRLHKRYPWNMHQCRNIGAKEACTEDENFWLFMSDIDIMLTPEMAYTMLDRELDERKVYTMERTFAPDFKDRKIHPNTFLVKRNAFWQINGYDLDLTPIGGGGYGGDGEFMRQLRGICTPAHFNDVVLVGYGRRQRDGEPHIPDADTRDLDRDTWQKKYRVVFDKKRATGDMRSRDPIRTEYERLWLKSSKDIP